MARKRFRRARARAGRFFKRARGSKKSVGVMNTIIGAAIYGMAREKVASLIDPLTSKVPMGIGDEVVLGVASYYLAKKGSGIMKGVGNAGLVIETARLSEGVTKGVLNKTSASSNGGNTAYVGYW